MKTKICQKCKQTKDAESSFSKSSRHKDGYQNWCKDCVAKSNKVTYQNNKERYSKYRDRGRARTKEWFDMYKKSLTCKNCGNEKWYMLEFHHRDPKTKDSSVADAVHHGWGLKRIKEEIEKCDVLCANCHREFHYLEKNNTDWCNG